MSKKRNAMRPSVKNGPLFLLVDAGLGEGTGIGGLGGGEAGGVEGGLGVELARDGSSRE